LATIAASLITALTLLFLVIQARGERRNTLAEFINSLAKELAEFDDLFEVLLLHRDGPTPELHREALLRCLRFFERVKTLCDVGVLDAKILDGMFGPQFVWLVNDDWVQERVLFEGEHFFPEIFALHQQLSTLKCWNQLYRALVLTIMPPRTYRDRRLPRITSARCPVTG
jgi:hypothetical protein